MIGRNSEEDREARAGGRYLEFGASSGRHESETPKLPILADEVDRAIQLSYKQVPFLQSLKLQRILGRREPFAAGLDPTQSQAHLL